MHNTHTNDDDANGDDDDDSFVLNDGEISATALFSIIFFDFSKANFGNNFVTKIFNKNY